MHKDRLLVCESFLWAMAGIAGVHGAAHRTEEAPPLMTGCNEHPVPVARDLSEQKTVSCTFSNLSNHELAK